VFVADLDTTRLPRPDPASAADRSIIER